MSLLLPKGVKRRRAEKPDATLRDRTYLDYLRTQRCIITGLLPSDSEAIDPIHVGTAGKAVKSPDNETLPVIHRLHVYGHNRGEMTMFRERLPDDVLRRALRALARELYDEWKKGQ